MTGLPSIAYEYTRRKPVMRVGQGLPSFGWGLWAEDLTIWFDVYKGLVGGNGS